MLRKRILVSLLLLLLLLQGFCLFSCADSDRTDMIVPPERALLIGQHYKDAVVTLQRSGFTNVFLRRTSESPTENVPSAGDVTNVFIDGNPSYDATAKIARDTEIIVVFFSDSINSGDELQSHPEQSVEVASKSEPSDPSEQDETLEKDGYFILEYDPIFDQSTLPVSVYLKGKIVADNLAGQLNVQDTNGDLWQVTFPSDSDFSRYVGTECEVYGHIYEVETIPLPKIVLDSEGSDRIVFPDGTIYWTSDSDDHEDRETEKTYVWISSNGSRYHRCSDCSGMKNPMRVTMDTAQSEGYSPCKRCYK